MVEMLDFDLYDAQWWQKRCPILTNFLLIFSLLSPLVPMFAKTGFVVYQHPAKGSKHRFSLGFLRFCGQTHQFSLGFLRVELF